MNLMLGGKQCDLEVLDRGHDGGSQLYHLRLEVPSCGTQYVTLAWSQEKNNWAQSNGKAMCSPDEMLVNALERIARDQESFVKGEAAADTQRYEVLEQDWDWAERSRALTTRPAFGAF